MTQRDDGGPELKEMAEKLFRAANPPTHQYCPYYTPPQLFDLWPINQEPYYRMADAMLKERAKP